MKALVLACALAACANLPDKASGVCGNGALDDKEDCDSSDPMCVACKIACTHDVGTPTPLPTCELGGEVVPGYRCGADDRCHAPSGAFAHETSAFDFPVSDGGGGDLDGDGIEDVIGFSDVNINVHFGDASGAAQTSDTIVVPVANAKPVLRRVRVPGSAAEKVDILLPTIDGIAAYTAQDKQIVPFPFSSDPRDYAACATQNGTRDPIAAYSIDRQTLALVTISPTLPHTLDVVIFDVARRSCDAVPMCGLAVKAKTDTLLFDVYHLATGKSVVAAGLSQPDAGKGQVCMISATPAQGVNGPIATLIRPVPIPTAATPPVLLRTRPSDVCPSLVTVASGGELSQYAGSLDASNACTVAAIGQLMSGLGGATPAGHIELVPPVMNQAPDALVVLAPAAVNQGASDVYMVNGLVTTLAYHSQRILFPVHSGDFDGDGRGDAIGAATFGLPAPDLDVLFRTSSFGASFLPYRIPTRGVARAFDVGDFDGNGIMDVVYVEHVGDRDQLMISYGTKDRPTTPVAVTSFTHVTNLAVLNVPDSLDPTGTLIDDLMVVDDTGEERPRLSLFHGNPQRSMLAFYDPRGVGTNTEIMAVVAGNFTPHPGGDGFPHDVIAFERFLPNTPVGLDTASLWVIQGDNTGEGVGVADKHATGLSGLACTMGQPICLPATRFTSWPIEQGASTRDLLIGIDEPGPFTVPERDVVTIDPSLATIAPVKAPAAVVTAMPKDAVMTSMFGADLDGDGKNELFIAFGSPPGSPTTGPGELLRCTVDPATAQVQSCKELSSIASAALPGDPGGDQWHCSVAYAADLQAVDRRHLAPARTGGDVVALCHVGSNDAPHSAAVRFFNGPTGVEAQPLSDILGAVFLARADVNGDTLTDLVVVDLEQNGMVPRIQIYLQCEATDATCIANRMQGAVVTAL
jgi:hypothetical protein